MSDKESSSEPNSRRDPVSKRLRFEVFKRDSFTCHYCGRKAPDVLLHVDHIAAVVAGGSSDLMNLITACVDCNLGKADKPLSDASVAVKRRAQVELMQERREQLEMLAQWQAGLMDLKKDEVEIAHSHRERITQYGLNDKGQHELGKLLRKFPLNDILEGMQIAADRNLEIKDGKPTKNSVEKAWRFLERSCSVNDRDRKEPGFKRILYVRGILRNRLDGRYYNHDEALNLLTEARDNGVDLSELERVTKRTSSWTNWKAAVEELMAVASGDTARTEPNEPKPTHQSERQALSQALADALTHVRTEDLPRIIGYAKGTGLSAEAFGEYDGVEQPSDRAVVLADEPEAFGFGDALGLQRTRDRSERLVAFGPINQATAYALETDHIEGLRPSYKFIDPID